jgi:hypothetical protein
LCDGVDGLVFIKILTHRPQFRFRDHPRLHGGVAARARRGAGYRERLAAGPSVATFPQPALAAIREDSSSCRMTGERKSAGSNGCVLTGSIPRRNK